MRRGRLPQQACHHPRRGRRRVRLFGHGVLSIMPLRNWHPPPRKLPSLTHRGEASPAPIHEAAGAALDQWEALERSLAQLFGVLCESPSKAPRRAYGTITGALGRVPALEAAAFEFFQRRDAEREADQSLEATHDAWKNGVSGLIDAYSKAGELRNNIAHGMVSVLALVQEGEPVGLGMFLHAPSYATRKLDREAAWQSKYFYRKKEIDHCRQRFERIAFEVETYIFELKPVIPGFEDLW